MQSWKIEEIKLLRSDIEDRLKQMGFDPMEAKTVSTSSSEYKGIGSDTDIAYLNARFHRIELLLNSEPQ